jgi:hypothetical protein
MRIILISILVSIIVAVGGTIIVSKKHWKEKAKTEVKDDFLSIPDYDKDEGVKTIVSPPAPINTGDVSYWFVVVQKDNGTMMNTIMQQNHKGFSLSEAKAELGGDKAFILNFIQVSKETWDINN